MPTTCHVPRSHPGISYTALQLLAAYGRCAAAATGATDDLPDEQFVLKNRFPGQCRENKNLPSMPSGKKFNNNETIIFYWHLGIGMYFYQLRQEREPDFDR
jgi:hypothetical protein